MINYLKLQLRKILFHFSKKDIEAILKYDPLDILKERNNKDV